MNTKDNVIIFSAYKDTNTPQWNEVLHQEALKLLDFAEIEYLELSGKYNGVEEKSVLVLAKHRTVIANIAKSLKQDCYLESHNDRHTELVYLDGRRVSLGTLRPVPKEVADTLDSWSYRADIDQYYAASKEVLTTGPLECPF